MLAPWPLYLLRLLDSSGGQGLCSWGDELVIILLVNSGTYIVQSKTSILRLPSIFTHCMSHRVHPVYSLCPVYQVHSVYSNHALSLSTCQRHQWNPEFVIIRVWHSFSAQWLSWTARCLLILSLSPQEGKRKCVDCERQFLICSGCGKGLGMISAFTSWFCTLWPIFHVEDPHNL